MEQNQSQGQDLDQDHYPFPGQVTGIVRVFIKRSEHEDSVQLCFDLSDEEPHENY